MRLLKKFVDVLFWLMLLCFGACFITGASATLFEQKLGLPLRTMLSHLTELLPFSVFEVLLIVTPLLLLAFLAHGKISGVTVTAKLVVTGYILTLGIPSQLPPRVSDPGEPTMDEYVRAAELVCEQMNTLSPGISDVQSAVNAATDYARSQLGIDSAYNPTVKPSLAPAILTDMGVLAYYAFPTAELAVNGTAPEFMRLFSAAHEAMHFLGIMREDEANLYAFVSLSQSADDTLKYAAYLNAFVYIGAEIGTRNSDTYDQIYAKLPENARNLLSMRRKFLSDGDDRMSAVSTAIGDRIVSLRDPRGLESYSYTSRLIVEHLLQ